MLLSSRDNARFVPINFDARDDRIVGIGDPCGRILLFDTLLTTPSSAICRCVLIVAASCVNFCIMRHSRGGQHFVSARKERMRRSLERKKLESLQQFTRVTLALYSPLEIRSQCLFRRSRETRGSPRPWKREIQMLASNNEVARPMCHVACVRDIDTCSVQQRPVPFMKRLTRDYLWAFRNYSTAMPSL